MTERLFAFDDPEQQAFFPKAPPGRASMISFDEDETSALPYVVHDREGLEIARFRHPILAALFNRACDLADMIGRLSLPARFTDHVGAILRRRQHERAALRKVG